VKAAVQKGFIDPAAYSSGKLNANAPLSRGELAVWLTNGLAKVDADYGTALKDVTNTVVPAKEYFTGKLPATQKNAVAVAMGTGLMSVGEDKQFGIDRTTTRAEVAVLLARYEAAAHKQPADFQGLQELREVGLTGTNLKVIAPKYVKIPEERLTSNHGVITDDFSEIRGKQLKTVTNYADVKIDNWIIVNPYSNEDKRSIYYPVFLDKSENNDLMLGAYYSFVEFDMVIKGTMTQLQAGSLFNSPTINAMLSPTSRSSSLYHVPKVDDFAKGNRSIFTEKYPTYWGTGFLHFDRSVQPEVRLTTEDNLNYRVVPKET
ncbi:S-layer homology domain-containing protein, partial [Paenibacillus physcomitrellae]